MKSRPHATSSLLAHLGIPHMDLADWTLDIAGLVKCPRRLRFADLARYSERTLEAFHECAGNPMTPHKPERRIANVVWGGVALADVLADAGIVPEAAYVWSYGVDHGTFAGAHVPYYLKDLPLARLAEGDVLLATEVNGEPLSVEHGFPARLVVPGFYGTNSVKWLYRIELADKRADGLFTTHFYNEPGPEIGSPLRPVWAVAPESVIVHPAPGAVLPFGLVEVRGWAWADGGVVRAKLSVDEGRTWTEADVAPPRERSWQAFRADMSIERPGQSDCSGVRSVWRRTTARGCAKRGAQRAVRGRRRQGLICLGRPRGVSEAGHSLRLSACMVLRQVKGSMRPWRQRRAICFR